MKVAIAGAGLTGAYLYRRLEKTCDVQIFDRQESTRCRLTPCAWGTTPQFAAYPERCSLDPEDYIGHRSESVLLSQVPIQVSLATIDKPAFIKDLLQQTPVRYGKLDPRRFDRVIDATGLSRAFLPPAPRDMHIPCIQYLVKTRNLLPTRISFVKVGYAWCFPLGEQKYHIGCANLLEDPRESLMHLGWLEQAQKRTTPVCTCSGSVRIASVHQSRPFVAGNIWGVGEAIGCVSPLVGEGIVPGLESAEILLRHWNDPEQYTQTILETFSWMRKEREVVDRLFAGKSPGIRDAWIIRKNSKRMGIRFSRAQLLHLVRVLR